MYLVVFKVFMCTSRMASRNTDIQELKDQWSAALQSYRQLQLDFKIMREDMVRTERRVDALWRAMTSVEQRLGLRVEQTPQPMHTEGAPKPKNRPSAAARRRRRAREEEAERDEEAVLAPGPLLALPAPGPLLDLPTLRKVKAVSLATEPLGSPAEQNTAETALADLLGGAPPRDLPTPIRPSTSRAVRFIPAGYERVEAASMGRASGQESCPGPNLDDLRRALPLICRGTGRGTTLAHEELTFGSRDARCRTCYQFHERNLCPKISGSPSS